MNKFLLHIWALSDQKLGLLQFIYVHKVHAEVQDIELVLEAKLNDAC